MELRLKTMFAKHSALTTAAWLTASSVAVAHPGHGHDGGSFSLLHYLTEPLHFLQGVLLAAGVVGVALVVMRRRKRKDHHS